MKTNLSSSRKTLLLALVAATAILAGCTGGSGGDAGQSTPSNGHLVVTNTSSAAWVITSIAVDGVFHNAHVPRGSAWSKQLAPGHYSVEVYFSDGYLRYGEVNIASGLSTGVTAAHP